MNQDNDYKIKKYIDDLYSSEKQLEFFSDDQKKSIFNFLILELIKKENKLKKIQKDIINNKIKNTNDINRILDLMTEEDKLRFIEFLNNKN